MTRNVNHHREELIHSPIAKKHPDLKFDEYKPYNHEPINERNVLNWLCNALLLRTKRWQTTTMGRHFGCTRSLHRHDHPGNKVRQNSEPIKQGISRRKMPKIIKNDLCAVTLLNRAQPLEMARARQICWDFDEICGKITASSNSIMNK